MSNSEVTSEEDFWSRKYKMSSSKANSSEWADSLRSLTGVDFSAIIPESDYFPTFKELAYIHKS